MVGRSGVHVCLSLPYSRVSVVNVETLAIQIESTTKDSTDQKRTLDPFHLHLGRSKMSGGTVGSLAKSMADKN